MGSFSAALIVGCVPSLREVITLCAAMNIDTEKVINEVRARELLWDISHELYKDRDARLSAWQQICRQVVPNFGNMTAREQAESGKQ